MDDDPAWMDRELEKGCRLLSGTSGGLAQVGLACFVLASLVVKRYREVPQRPVKVWALDVSKQGFSAFLAHACGMLWAVVLASMELRLHATECGWYLVVFCVDTSVGMGVSIALHRYLLAKAQRVASAARCYHGGGALTPPRDPHGAPRSYAVTYQPRWLLAIARCGDYGTPPSVRRWAPQMAEWAVCVLVGRMASGATVVALSPLFAHVAQWIDAMFVQYRGKGVGGNNDAELWTVMVMGPVGLNILQALVQDAILRMKRAPQTRTAPAEDVSLDQFADAVEEDANATNQAPLLGLADIN